MVLNLFEKSLTLFGSKDISPCHTDLPEKDHAIANGVTGLGGALGAWVSSTNRLWPCSLADLHLVVEVLQFQSPAHYSIELSALVS